MFVRVLSCESSRAVWLVFVLIMFVRVLSCESRRAVWLVMDAPCETFTASMAVSAAARSSFSAEILRGASDLLYDSLACWRLGFFLSTRSPFQSETPSRIEAGRREGWVAVGLAGYHTTATTASTVVAVLTAANLTVSRAMFVRIACGLCAFGVAAYSGTASHMAYSGAVSG